MKKAISFIYLLFFVTPLTYANEPPPFSTAVKVNHILYLSGQIGTEKLGQPTLIKGGIIPETHKVMQNIKKVLENNGSSLNRVFKCTVMMADMKEWPLMNKVYASYFSKGHYPARSAFGATGLALNARVEIECIATAD